MSITTTSHRLRRTTLALAAVAVAAAGPLALASAPSASAAAAPTQSAAPTEPTAARAAVSPGSLLFIRDDNVWISRTDGTDARRLTTDGDFEHPWLSPTQAANGLIAAAHADRIVTMRPSGRVVSSLNPPPLENSVGDDIDGTPGDVAISPDGSLIAYTFNNFSCPSGADCDTRFVTAYTRSDRMSDPATLGTTYGDAPAWITNRRTVQGAGQIAKINVHDLGSSEAVHWFRDSELSSPARDLTDPVVSPDHRYVASIRGFGNTTTVLWSEVNGDIEHGAPSLPSPICETNEEPVASPAFSADSRLLAWVLPRTGIWMTADPGACNQPRLVVRDAEQPSFSAATFTVPAPEATARPSTAGTAKVGRVLTARPGSWTPTPTSYAYQWLRDGKAIRGATAARYKLTAKDARHLVAVRVTARGKGGSTAAVSAGRRVAR